MKLHITLIVFSLYGTLVATDLDLSLLRRVCDPNESVFYFTSLEEVQHVLKGFLRSPSDCPDTSYHGSFTELNKLLQPEYLNDVCSENTYWRIRDYHTTFISPYTPEINSTDLKALLKWENKGLMAIPESLKRFFILFVKQINGQCRRDLVARLESLTDAEILNEEYDLVKNIKDEGSRLFGSDYVQPKRKIEQLWVEMHRRQATDDEANWLHVQVKFGDVLKKIQDACTAKFRPVYEELFSPMIRLANLGYSDISNTEFENFQLRYEDKFSRWADIIETCESLKYVDVIQDSSTQAALADMIELNSVIKNEADRRRAQTVTILSASEAAQLKTKIAEETVKHDKATLYEPNRISVEHLPIKATTLMWTKDPKLREFEVKKFKEIMRKRISDKTNVFKLWKKRTAKHMKLLANKYRLQFVTRDQKSALGRLSSFMDRHPLAIKVFSAAIGFAVAMILFTG